MKNKRLSDMLIHYLGTDKIGSWVHGEIIPGHGEPIDLIQAHDEQRLLSYHDADDALVATLDDAAKVAQKSWWERPAKERGRIMYQIGAEIRQEAGTMAWIESITANKPYRGAQAEVMAVAEMFEYYAGWADKLHGEVIPVPTSHLNYVKYEAMGTIFQITPWNAPFFTAGWQIAPAINSDTHAADWGSRAAMRTGIVAPTLTQSDLLAAMRARRVKVLIAGRGPSRSRFTTRGGSVGQGRRPGTAHVVIRLRRR